MINYSFKKIATAIAFSPRLKANLNESVRIAKKLDATLVLIHIGIKTSEKENTIQQFLKDLTFEANLEIIWKEGKPEEVIASTTKELGVDLLIAGALINETLYRYYVGSIARKLTRTVKCSLLLLTNPSEKERLLDKVVINGIENPKTANTIKVGVEFLKKIGSKNLHIVEEVNPKLIKITAKDSKTIKKAEVIRDRIRKREKQRVKELLKKIDIGSLRIESKVIFGKSGYSVGHYAQSIKADLLIMNSSDKRMSVFDRIFKHDIEYILSDLPCDLLIVKE
ncbi:MAG: universal stress protein [Flavobacteriales bacterium]